MDPADSNPTAAPERAERRCENRKALGELAGLFLRLGCTAFGGPAAHIAMMEDEVVRRRRWLTREELLDLIGAANLIPGPTSTELAIHIGHRRGGWPGLIVAGVCFISPAVAIVSAIAWAYVRYGKLPEVGALLYGVKPVIIAIVAHALWRLARTAIRNATLAGAGVAAAAAVALGAHELLVLFGIGAVMLALRAANGRNPFRGAAGLAGGLPWLATIAPGAGAAGVAAGAVGLWPLFGFFLKVGALLFGSGYVLLAFVRADLVERWHWLTEAQLLDAIAVGQFTPGPIFTTATFIGYVLAGGAGAAVATLGIFLPAFVFVAISGPLVPRLRRSPLAGAFLDGVNVASLGLMLVVTCQLGAAALVDVTTVVLAVAAAAVLLRFKLNSAWLVLAGAIIGIVARWLA